MPSVISDTGATSTAGARHDPFHSTTKPSSKVFLLPTGGTAQATHISQLMLNVRAPANQVDIVPNLTQTLLSGSKFADAGVTDAHTPGFGEYPYAKSPATSTTIPSSWTLPVYVVPSTKEIRALLASSRTREQHTILNVYKLPSIEQTIRYLHAAAGFTTKTTWMAAIWRGNYDTWPLVTIANVHKHFPQSEETQQGHMRSQRQGVRSTKTTLQAPANPPSHTAPSLPHHDIYIKTYATRDTVYTDQTGKFPHLSSRGHRYQMILYHTNSNLIWVEPTKNRTEGELILARTRALSRMRACGLSPKRQVLDNEASAAYKQAILDSGMTYQLVPPDDHRRNVAKKAVQTWKDHFVAVLSGTADKFPLHLWCQLIPHMERQLNLLRQSNANPRISAYAHLYGPHDYNASPFVPLGTEALTYAQHYSKGWVIGTSIEHYRCWKIWSPTTRSTCIAATVFFKHKYLTNPSMSPTDALIAAAANLAHVIKHNAKAQHVGAKNLQDLQHLQQRFSDAAKQPPLPPRPTTPIPANAPPPTGATTYANPHCLAAALHQPRYL
eukprot:CCRYP_009355-RA/>CCRYP_009355-RA protein AED:0.29 eAED:0.33 QI:0/0/0/1/0.66/0.5/4/0/552